MDKKDYIFGLRAVIEAIEAGKDIDKILIRKGLSGDLSGELLRKIKENAIPSQWVPAEKLNRITLKNHQGVIALLSPVAYHPLEMVVPQLYEEGRNPFIVLLDGVTDTRNFGAIARSALCAGADAIIIPERNSASVTPDAVKTSAGALLHIPVCRVKRLPEAVKFLKESGLMIAGATEKSDHNYTQCDFFGPLGVVMGAEDTGISPEILNLCDEFATIPIDGGVGSLNVSVAAGVIFYEVVRQRGMK